MAKIQKAQKITYPKMSSTHFDPSILLMFPIDKSVASCWHISLEIVQVIPSSTCMHSPLSSSTDRLICCSSLTFYFKYILMIVPYQYMKSFLILSYSRVVFYGRTCNSLSNSTQGNWFAVNNMVHMSFCTWVICRIKLTQVGLLGQSQHAFVILIDIAKCFPIKVVPAVADFPTPH